MRLTSGEQPVWSQQSARLPPPSRRPPRVRGFAMTRAKTPQEKIAKLRQENKKLRPDLQAKTKELNKQKNLMKMAAKSLGKTAGYFAVAAGLEPDSGRAKARPAAVEPAAGQWSPWSLRGALGLC